MPGASAKTPSAERHWSLFADWCDGTGRDATAVTTLDLVAFAAQVPVAEATLRERLAVIVRRLGWVEATGATGQAARRSTGRFDGESTLSLPAALVRCETRGWPGGFKGRRDAFLLVCLAPVHVGGLGLSVERVRSLTPRDFRVAAAGVAYAPEGFVGAVPVPRHQEAAMCPACAVARWLEAAGEAARWSERSAAELLRKAPSVTGSEAPHACEDVAGSRWSEGWWLALAIDQYGWRTDWRPMSERSVREVLYRRTDKAAPGLRHPEGTGALPDGDRDEVDGGEPEEPSEVDDWRRADASDVEAGDSGYGQMTYEEQEARLDEVSRQADEINARIAEILATEGAAVRAIGDRI